MISIIQASRSLYASGERLLLGLALCLGTARDGSATLRDARVDRAGEMRRDYYDIDDFLAREHAVTVEFVWGAATVGPEVIGPKAKKDSNGRADVPKEHRAPVPLWWLDGEMAKDVYICETPAAFADDVFALLKAVSYTHLTLPTKRIV